MVPERQDFDPDLVWSELRRLAGEIAAAPDAAGRAYIDRCLKEFRERKPTKATRWCLENGGILQRDLTPTPGGDQVWASLLLVVLRNLYGGEQIWQNRRPTEAKLTAARRLTAKQLQETFGISRARAYQLLKQVRRKPQKV